MATSEELLRRQAQTKEIIEAGKKIYEGIKGEVEKRYFGKFIVIDIQTGKYVIGDSALETDRTFEKQFGDIPAFARRIGLEYPLFG